MGFFSRRRRGVIGLDVGTSSVKAMMVHQMGDRCALLGFGLSEHPAGTLEAGEIHDQTALIGSIREAVGKVGGQTKDVVIGLSGNGVILKRIRVPKMPKKELRESIKWEAEQHIPFEMDEVTLDCQPLGPAGNRATQIDVMLVAVKKTKLDQYVETVRAAGLNVVVVDVDAFALENQFEMNYPEQRGDVVALVNLGAEIINANILQRGVSVYARDISFGGHKFGEVLGQRFGIPLAEAEVLMRGKEIPGIDRSLIQASLDSVTAEMGGEIQRTLDYFDTTPEHERIDRILLSGGCVLLPGLWERLADLWRVEVAIMDPFRNVAIEGEGPSGEEMAAVAPRAAVALGLALRWPGDRP